MQHLAPPYIRAGGEALSSGWAWGVARLCVAQFLANLWHAIATTRAGIAAVRQARRGWLVSRWSRMVPTTLERPTPATAEPAGRWEKGAT
jgi:hypothetical protein